MSLFITNTVSTMPATRPIETAGSIAQAAPSASIFETAGSVASSAPASSSASMSAVA